MFWLLALLFIVIFLFFVIVANIISIPIIHCLRSSIKKYNINDYFCCTWTNQISMRWNFKLYWKHDHDFHKNRLYNNFSRLGVNQEYYCVSHTLTLRKLQDLESKGYITIIRIDEKKESAKTAQYERWLKKKIKIKKKHPLYKITFYTLKQLPES